MTAYEIVLKLQDLGYEAYFVGGYVRDMLLGKKCDDIDITTSATPDELITIFKDRQIKTAGKNFLVTFVDDIEVATYRVDNYKNFNPESLKVLKANSAKEDVIRRDFTINSLLYDPSSKKIIDYVNGQSDLQEKIIRFNGNPKERIFEDPVRIIRACRFAAKINGKFERETLAFLRTYSDYITMIPGERIRLEILKAMKIKNASLFFEKLHEIDGLKYIFPSIENSYGVDGGPYHIETVFEHLMMAGDHCSTKYPLLKLASYMHDIGKPISKRINPSTGGIWFEGHDETGRDAAKIELEDLKFSGDEINLISNLIGLHMRISNERLQPKSIRRTLKTLSDFNIPYQNLLRVSICDKMGGLKSQKTYKLKNVYELCKLFKEQVERKDPVSKFSDLKINGNDIMEITGLKPGKEVGYILKYLLDLVLDNPELNDVQKLKEIIITKKFILKE